MTVRPYPFARWPQVPARQVQLLSRLARRHPLPEPAAAARELEALIGGPLRVRPGTPAMVGGDDEVDGPPPPEGTVAVVLRGPGPGDGAPVVVELDEALALSALTSALGATSPHPRGPRGPLSDGERGALAYLAARTLAAGLAEGWRVGAVVTTGKALRRACGPGPHTVWPADVHLGELRATARLRVPESAIDILPERRDAPEAARLAGIELTLVVEAGGARLPLSELGTARAGDVLVLDEALHAPGAHHRRVRVRLAGAHRTTWWCTATSEALRLDSVERASVAPIGKGRSMTDGNTMAEALERTGDAPIEVSVELARFTLPLEQLAHLRPGEVLLSGRAVGERVALRTGDRTLAVGELVDVEGEVGVRILGD
ncbi:MAG: type III secretion system cytoplasmic ring protein SctQ [Myxococcota bacterium]